MTHAYILRARNQGKKQEALFIVLRDILEGFNEIGATCHPLKLPGKPVILLVGFRRRTYTMAITATGEKLTPHQISFMNEWKGHDVIHIDSALAAIEVMTK